MSQWLTCPSHGSCACVASVRVLCVRCRVSCVRRLTCGSLSACVLSLSLAASVRHACVCCALLPCRSQATRIRLSARLTAARCIAAARVHMRASEQRKLAKPQQKKLVILRDEKVVLTLREKWPEAHRQKVGLRLHSPCAPSALSLGEPIQTQALTATYSGLTSSCWIK